MGGGSSKGATPVETSAKQQEKADEKSTPVANNKHKASETTAQLKTESISEGASGGGSGSAETKSEDTVEGNSETNTDVVPIEEKKMILLLFGPPGAGKGTQSPKISGELNIPVFSTGDMLRSAVTEGTPTGLKAKEIMKAGGLVSDEIVMDIITHAVADQTKGYILDGFPRTLAQNELLQKSLEGKDDVVSSVLHFKVDDSDLQDRIVGRWIHKPSGRSYHERNAKPNSLVAAGEGAIPDSENMADDETGELLIQRSDDTEEALKNRLTAYHAETKPILEFYAEKGVVIEIDCNKEIAEVSNQVDEVLSQLRAN